MIKIIQIILELLNKIPFQEKRERWRNQLDTFKEEKKKLLAQPPTYQRARRLTFVNKFISKYERLLKNS